ncbi:GTP-binding protein [Pisolithus orientalis]|uniref:GTP-binding protein n=1 Tax=Pisolithus orientalis TaxID=936130 RepID=UPI0022247E21|nr:GTP-binding protein [Pisolithus orientalis]KAI6030652.1 GTP-binding protein [Pisolithus orientalis]
MDPEKAKKYLENIEKFRILVIGRGNAGKTTILQRVCNSVDEPDVFDGEGNKHGYHKIDDELVFKSNPGFVFHDSGFEEMKRFVIDHAAARMLKKCIHAIWYCIPMTDYHRTVTAAEQKFFNEYDTGHVPVVVLLTKADALNFAAMEELLDEELEVEEAEERATERESLLLEKWQTHIKQILDKCKFPPKMYLPLTKMHNESADCTTLIQSTASALNEEGLQRLLLSTQQSSIGLCIEYAVHWLWVISYKVWLGVC